MRNLSLMAVDDFLPDALYVREQALAKSFGKHVHKGVAYDGIGTAEPPNLDPFISAAVGESVKTSLSFFRLSMAGMPMNTYIHADATESEFAGVLYLHEPNVNHGGTAFWKHCGTGWREVQPVIDQDMAAMLGIDGKDDTKWIRESYVKSEFNRFLTYPSRLFHSRYPNQCDSPTKDGGRLVLACFYDLA